MESVSLERSKQIAGAMRIAVVGCGHGTLDSIYASIDKACEIKGWDAVDLVIVGGDFQAVRDLRDLNVTAMPVKYRALKDFQQYYQGIKVAPYLTVFTGGNHEASNYNFELYYGGWAAPRIYYLGAVNVIQFGPLKIAAMSGIWKGYDYNKPHYERLPYNANDIISVFHVRELDVRKLLAFRSQVDIGLSHDWPRGIVWHGNWKQLFVHKPFLQGDAESGSLGNLAAEKVMNHLRPAYWFAAHLHTRFSALKSHKDDQIPQEKGPKPVQAEKTKAQTQRVASPPANPSSSKPHRDQLLAWGNFGVKARKEEAEVTAKLTQEEHARRQEAERTGVPITANYTFEETYKKVKPGTGIQRDVESVSHTQDRQPKKENARPLPQLDGTCLSGPLQRLKRRRESSSPPTDDQHANTQYASIADAQNNTVDANPDAIDVDMTDEDDESIPLTAIRGNVLRDSFSVMDSTIKARQVSPESDKGEHENSGQVAKEAVPRNAGKATQSTSQNVEEQQADLLEASAAEAKNRVTTQSAHDEAATAKDEVSDEMRTKLVAISSTFEKPARASAPLPPPEAIKNKATRFLALSKCEDRQNFLQLVEIQPLEAPAPAIDRPYTLQYVPEWLAIQRVFASELKLGGKPQDKIPGHKGDTHYREQIIEEEKWIKEFVEKPGLLQVPENFVHDIATYSSDPVTSDDMPREVTNSQTTAYCKLIGIDNPFDISEGERDARMAAGPAEVPVTQQRPGSGNSHFGRRGRARGAGAGDSRGGGGSSNWRGSGERRGNSRGTSQNRGNSQTRGNSERGGRGRGNWRGGRGWN